MLNRGANHYRDLDGVRGVLAATVMLFHYDINPMIVRLTRGAIADPAWDLSVDFFFVLSGFVLARSYHLRPRGFGRRMAERAFRLLPVHLVIMAALVPLFADRNAVATAIDVAAATIYFGTERWNPPSWSINVELYLPVLLAPLVPFAARARKWPLLLAVIVLGTAQAVLCWRVAAGADLLVIPRGFVGLAMGGTLYALVSRGILKVPALPLPPLVALLLLTMLATGVEPAFAILAPLVAAAVVVAGTRSEGMFGGGVFAAGGALSYTLYMVHYPVKLWTLHLLHTDRFDGSIVARVAMIVASITLATLLTLCVELPGMRLGQRIMRRENRERATA